MGFRNVKFSSRRRTGAEATVGVLPSAPNWVRFCFRGSVLEKLRAKEGDLVTPLVDERNFLVLLVVRSDAPNGEERRLIKKGQSLQVDFPRRDVFRRFFDGPGGSCRPMSIIELGPERIVFEGGLVFGKGVGDE